MIPHRIWPRIRLGECIVMNKETYSQCEEWPFVNYFDTGSITDNRIEAFQRLDTGDGKLPSRARRKVQTGDIVFSTVRPNQRHFGLLRDIPENVLASTGFAVFHAREDIADTGFIYWFLAQDQIVERLQTIAEHSTSAYPAIRSTDICELEIDLPPLPEQRAIAHILGTLDDKIQLNRQMNQTLEAIARTIFKDWFVNFGPVRAKMEGRDPYLPSEIWELFPDMLDGEGKPAGWETRRIENILHLEYGKSLPAKKRIPGKVPVYGSGGCIGTHRKFAMILKKSGFRGNSSPFCLRNSIYLSVLVSFLSYLPCFSLFITDLLSRPPL